MKKLSLLGATALGSFAFIGFAATPAAAQTPTTASPTGDACQAPANTPDKTKCPDVSGPEAASQAAEGATDATAPAAGNTPAAEAEGIVVVGSRIRRNQFNTADPIQLITREEATQAGFNSTAEVLQSTAVTGGSSQISNIFGGFVTAGGPGANTVSLRGLGTTRTLVLLNGRRIAPAGSRGQVGATDLNTLPNAMIDRIEILNTGASSIYGSDAVAGVINIVTRTNVEGLTLEGQHNITEHGGGNSRRYSAVFGHHADNWQFAGSLEYYSRDHLRFGQRDWALCQTAYRRSGAGAAPGTGDTIDVATGQPKCYPIAGGTGESGVTINTIGTPNFTGAQVALAPSVPAGYTGTCNRFRPNGAAGKALPGFECVGGGTLSTNLRDTFPGAILHDDLVSPAKVYTGYLEGSVDTGVLGNAQFYAELLATRRKSEQISNRQLTIDYPQGSPLIPPLLRFATPFLGPQPGGITGTNNIGIRVFANYGNYSNRQTVDFVKLGGGLRGDLPMNWRYDLFLGKTWSDADYTTDLILTSRIAQSLDVVQNANGTFSCRNPLAGCVAAPAITPDVVGGTFPADWFNWINSPVTGHTSFDEQTASLNIDGPLFALPGGDIQLALGAEYRKSTIDDTPSQESVNGNLYGFTSSTPTRGSDSVWEVYGEVELPIIRNSFIKELTINASGRYTHYKSYGGQHTYKVGGLFSPIDWLSFRGSYGTSYRAPALFEQFLGATSGFQAGTNDPCNSWDALPTGSPRRANCQSEGLPAGFQANTSITVLQRGGAATGLKAETSTAWTAGGVFQPKLGPDFGDLSLSADYFNVLVKNGVSQLGFSTILAQCYDDPRFRTTSICDNVTRNPTAPFGLTVTTGYLNVSHAKVAGWDFNLRYARDLGPGRIRLSAAVTKFNTRYNQTLPSDPIFNNIGTLNNPRWTGTFDASYTFDNWTLRYGVDWVQAVNSSAAYIGITQAVRDTYVLEVPDYYLHSASIRYQAGRFGILLGVRNLFDKDPPQVSSGFYNRAANAPLYSGYDFLGRTFFVNVTTHF